VTVSEGLHEVNTLRHTDVLLYFSASPAVLRWAGEGIFTRSETPRSQGSLSLEPKHYLQSRTTRIFSPHPDGSHQRTSPTANSTFRLVESLHLAAIGLGAFLFPTNQILKICSYLVLTFQNTSALVPYVRP